MNSNFSFIDLFAGIGGFRIALQDAGGTCVGFSEIASDAISAYCRNFNEDPHNNLGDICKLHDLPKHDFLTGGVPCQSWSIAGKNLGFDDSRGQLWNDALFLLNKARPKAFIFENVKGLADPRNKNALRFIMETIAKAGYSANFYLLNAFDYGVPQNRVRIYIIGFKERKFATKFRLPQKQNHNSTLAQVINGNHTMLIHRDRHFGTQSLSVNENGFNDYFLFNDLRGGDTTIHSWDITETSEREKHICSLLLQNRRKKQFGKLDGNPLSLQHFQSLDASISQEDIDKLIDKRILRPEKYLFKIRNNAITDNCPGADLLRTYNPEAINIDDLKTNREFKIRKINIVQLLDDLCSKGLAECTETRYDFKNTKISTGLNGINRIFLPTSKVYPTLVASDTNDYITDIHVTGSTAEEYKANFIRQVYSTGAYRRISKEEACKIQGFPESFILPPTRARWMKLIGNSVAVSLIRQLVQAVVDTGVFDPIEKTYHIHTASKTDNAPVQLALF